MHPTTPCLLTVLSCVPGAFVSAASASSPCPPEELSVRLPPYMDPALKSSDNTTSPSSSWVAPPDNFFTGTWYMTNTSRADYRHSSNLQWDVYPVVPSCKANSTSTCPPGTLAGTISDITTWALDSSNSSSSRSNFGAVGGGQRSVASTQAWDTPIRREQPTLGPEWDGVFHLRIVDGPANGYLESWAFTYWGVDAKGVPFVVIHESAGMLNGVQTNPPCLDAFSRSVEGPEAGSLQKVLKALEELGNEELAELVREMGATDWDYGLQGGAAICNRKCQTNGAAA